MYIEKVPRLSDVFFLLFFSPVAEALEDSDVELEIDFGPNSNTTPMKGVADEPPPSPGHRGEEEYQMEERAGAGGEATSTTPTTAQAEEVNSAVVGEEEDGENAVNDFPSEMVDGKALYFCSECNYQR